MFLEEIFIILSLALTATYLCFAIETLYLWHATYLKVLSIGNDSPSSNLTRGIYVGFFANVCDNLYWAVTWYSILHGFPIGQLLLMGGSIANVLFRQAGGIYSASRHVKAAAAHQGNLELAKYHPYYWALGVAALASLVVTKYIV